MKNFFKPIAKFADAIVRAGFHVVRATPIIGKVFARFEAAYTNWGARRWLWTAYQDARFEVDWSSTMEICRKFIYFCENNPVVRRIEWLRVQYATGVDGLQVVPAASDPGIDGDVIEKWNTARLDRWRQWCKSPDISNNLSMGVLTMLWEKQLFRVGNIIVIKTQDEKGNLAIQTVDRLRLQTPTQFAGEEGKTVCQGIRLKVIQTKVTEIDDSGKRVTKMKKVVTGRPDVYYIRDEFEMDRFAEVPAENVIHKFDVLMPGQMVGLPDGHAVINLLHDFEDLQILEMGAAKLAGKIATVENNRTGEKQAQTARTSSLNISGVNNAGAVTSKNVLYDYNVTVGAQEIALMAGDKLQNFMIERPTVAQQDYWDFLLNQICMGFNVPRLLVAPYSLQGTVTRADLAVARDAFRRDFELVADVLRNIYEWWSERDVKHNSANYGMKIPADHAACEIHPPDSPDVDLGYSASVLSTEMELGVTNLAQICGRRKLNWRTVIKQTAQIEQAIDAAAKLAGIDPARISSKLFKTGRSIAMEEVAGDPNADPKGKTPPASGDDQKKPDPDEIPA
jgi:hypothetical protein